MRDSVPPQLPFEDNSPPPGDETLQALRKGVLDIALKLGQGVGRDNKPYHWMIDCRELLLGGPYLHYAARLLWERIRKHKPDFVGGMTLAANPLTIAILYESRLDNQPVNAFLIRREPKADGLKKRVEGPPIPRGARLVLVDDIINSGETQLQALDALEPFGAQVVAVGAVVDCERAGSQLRAARQVPLEALFTLTGLGVSTQPPAQPGLLRPVWEFGPLNQNRNGVVKSGPCVSGDTIFVGSDAGFLAAISLDGREKWRFPVRDRTRGVHSSPAVFDGRVYFGGYDGYLYCVHEQTGRLAWECRLGQWIGSSPAVAPEAGLVFVGVESGEAGGSLIAVDRLTGKPAWSFHANGYVHGSPVYDAPRSQVLFGANDYTLYAVDLEGRQRWRFVTGGEIKARPAVDDSGRCFVCSFDGFVYALDAETGALLWRRRAGTSLYFTPLLYEDMVIVGGHSSRMVAYDRASGVVRWVATAGGRIMGGATCAGPGRIAFGAADGVVYLLDAHSGQTLDRCRTGDEIMATPAFADGLLLVPSMDHRLHAFSICQRWSTGNRSNKPASGRS
jgi:outer membrane protein assembly factor BamB/orotate phosphoribosyltransferase